MENIKIMPMLVMRGVVVFPDSTVHFDVGRKMSIHAVNSAMENGRMIYLAAQDDITLEQAASLAVYYSQGRGGGKVPVDYTQVRFVKKPSGAMPGKVIYTDYYTMMAEADEALAERLEKK